MIRIYVQKQGKKNYYENYYSDEQLELLQKKGETILYYAASCMEALWEK